MAHPAFPIKNPTLPPSSVAQEPNGKITASKLRQVPGSAGTYPFLEARVAGAWLAFVAAAARAGFTLGHTGCYRPYDRQVSLFLERHIKDPTGPKVWNGKRWRLKPGAANAAIPGTSPHGMGCAIDVALHVGKEVKAVTEEWSRWAVGVAPAYGFLWSLQSEPWHIQWVYGDAVPPALQDAPDEEDDDVLPTLIQSGADVWITGDWTTRRGVAPEDIALWTFLGSVQPIIVRADGVKEAKPISVTTTVLERMLDVSPGAVAARFATVINTNPTVPSPAAIAKAVNDDAAKRMAS